MVEKFSEAWEAYSETIINHIESSLVREEIRAGFYMGAWILTKMEEDIGMRTMPDRQLLMEKFQSLKNELDEFEKQGREYYLRRYEEWLRKDDNHGVKTDTALRDLFIKDDQGGNP